MLKFPFTVRLELFEARRQCVDWESFQFLALFAPLNRICPLHSTKLLISMIIGFGKLHVLCHTACSYTYPMMDRFDYRNY